MPLKDENDIALAFRNAVPIDDVDRLMAPSGIMAVVWLNIEDRPDIAYLAERHKGISGYSICTLFYESPGERKMSVGLYVEMREPTRTAFSIVFRVKQYTDQLEAIAQDGQIWFVPGPPPNHLVGTQEMTLPQFMEKVVAYSGSGVHIELEDHLRAELAGQLGAWKKGK